MKATGITRKIDHLGRVVIPKEIRTLLSMDTLAPVEFFVENDCVVIKRFESGCNECGEVETVLVGRSKICIECAAKLASYGAE